MLTPQERENTQEELQENYRRLGYDVSRVLLETHLSAAQLQAVLSMDGANPSHVWMVRDYLEDKLKEEGLEMMPFSRLGNHAANRWFHYETPWRE